ncbi:MAG TPA: hypothetical protein VGR35_14215 [Tepidisphaeraceae bacterium]|nr:hypothetical protein [Tepidisphaeraceae bacterium]
MSPQRKICPLDRLLAVRRDPAGSGETLVNTLFSRRGLTLSSWRRNLIQRLLSGAGANEISRLVHAVLALSPRYPSLIWPDHVMLRRRISDQRMGEAA